jgi:hypothetical protein
VGEVVMGRCEFGLTGVMIDGGARFEGEGGFIDRFDKVAAAPGLRTANDWVVMFSYCHYNLECALRQHKVVGPPPLLVYFIRSYLYETCYSP